MRWLHRLGFGVGFGALGLLAHCSGSDNIILPGNDAGPQPDTGVAETGPAPCDNGLTRCGDTCVDLQKDTANCGKCGTACGAKEVCSAGACAGCDTIDADKDGFDACVDCDDNDPNVNPGAFDIPGNNKDDDCNGKVDDEVACETNASPDTKNAADFAAAMEMCAPWVTASSFPTVADDTAHQVASDWGVFKPQKGSTIAALSTGIAADEDDTKPMFDKGVTPQQGTDFNKTGTPYPVKPGSITCIDSNKQKQTIQDPTTVNDYTELSVTLKVPTNAHSFAIDLNYLTSDAPEWLCSKYVDQALVILDSASLKGNVFMDANGDHMSGDSPFLVLNKASDLTGTGMDQLTNTQQVYGGGTGWMTLTAPVTPGDSITLRFAIFDVLDGIYDSQILMDHFRWQADKVCAPTTTNPLYDGGAADGGVSDGGSDGGCP